ncbi:MAG: carbohydrate ABC transporter permease [Candidatus Binatia bacterium]
MEEAAVYEEIEGARPRYLLDRKEFLGPLFLLPAVVYIIALVGIPFVIAIIFSLTDVTVGDTSLDFVGLENFRRIIKTPQFQRALKNSFLFTIVSQVFIIILANILAQVLSQDFRGKWVARMLIMLPWATPIALGTIGWLWLLDSKFSPIDWVLQAVHLLGPDTLLGPGNHMNFLGREGLAMASVIMVYVWRMLPLATVILMAGLTSIDQDVLDQAEVDGASFWRSLFQIKLPLILPIISIVILFSLIFTFGDMTVVYVLTRGGPIYYTQVLPTWAFFKGIEGGALSEGAAIAFFLFPLLLAVAILILRISRRMEVT